MEKERFRQAEVPQSGKRAQALKSLMERGDEPCNLQVVCLGPIIICKDRPLAKRPPFSLAQFLDAAGDDPRLAELLEDIRHEETPERLLDLARRLQEKLQESKHRRNPN